MPNYASKGLAGTALGLAIPGTVALANQLGSSNGDGGNRLLGGPFGNGNGKEVYGQALADNKILRDEIYAFVKPLSDEAANNRVEVAVLKEQIKCCCEKQELKDQLTKAELRGEIATVANQAACGINAAQTAIAGLQTVVSQITKLNVPLAAICPEVMPRYNSYVAPTATATEGA